MFKKYSKKKKINKTWKGCVDYKTPMFNKVFGKSQITNPHNLTRDINCAGELFSCPASRLASWDVWAEFQQSSYKALPSGPAGWRLYNVCCSSPTIPRALLCPLSEECLLLWAPSVPLSLVTTVLMVSKGTLALMGPRKWSISSVSKNITHSGWFRADQMFVHLTFERMSLTERLVEGSLKGTRSHGCCRKSFDRIGRVCLVAKLLFFQCIRGLDNEHYVLSSFQLRSWLRGSWMKQD